MPSTYSPSALPVKAGRGLISPSPNILSAGGLLYFNVFLFYRIPIRPDLPRSPFSFAGGRSLSLPVFSGRERSVDGFISPPPPSVRFVEVRQGGYEEQIPADSSIRPIPALSEIDSRTGRSGGIYLEGGRGAAGVDQDNDSWADQAPGLNIEFIHSGTPGVKTEAF